MSIPSASDDGDPATRWEDTSIKQEFEAVRAKWAAWQRGNRHEFPSDEFAAFVRIADMVLDEISEYLTGKI